VSLPKQYAINFLLDKNYSKRAVPYHMAITYLTPKQHLKIKSSIMNTNNHLNKVFPFFDSLNKELSLGFYLVDTFSNYFEDSLINQNMVLIISDTSIKNNVATSISHFYRGQEIITKSVHHTMNIISTEAELFAIRCGINCAIHLQNVECIIVITDATPAAKQIFDISMHLYQLHSITIFKDLRGFFNKNPNNLIDFWDCLESVKWSPHTLVNRELKHLQIDPILPSKSSWEFNRKKECDFIINKWQMYFQASEYRGKNFMDLNDDNNQHIHPTYTKEGAWLKHFGLSNSLCAHITRLIINHAPIGKYRLRFFPKESIACLCGNYPIEMRRHILFKKSWNPKRESLKDITMFLEFNPGAFCLQDSILV